MRRFGAGVLVGILLAAALAWAGAAKVAREPNYLTLWKGEGRRSGLYSYSGQSVMDRSAYLFYECKQVGEGKVTPPAK